MAQKKVDQTTLQPDGRLGDDAFTSFAKLNDNADDAEARLHALEIGGVDPGAVAALQADIKAIGGDNLLPNSSFETRTSDTAAPTGWQYGGSLPGSVRTYVDSPLPGSVKALRIEGVSTAASQYIDLVTPSGAVKVVPDQLCVASAWARGNGASTASIITWFQDAAGANIGSAVEERFIPEATWRRKVATPRTAPANAASVRVHLRLLSTAAGQALAVEWDNAQVQQGRVATGFAPSVAEAAVLGSTAQATATAAQATADAVAIRATLKNMLINCGVPINQRGFAGGALAAGVYGYDRWKAGTGGCNVTISAITGVITHASGPLQQLIEAPDMAWGQPLTISVENPSSAITVSVGGASGTIAAGSGRRGVTVTPTGSGNMTLQLTATGATYSRPQLERGPSATAFDARPQALELVLCQAYFETSFNLGVAPSGGSSAGDTIAGAFSTGQARTARMLFRVKKRATPALTLYTSAVVTAGTAFWALYNGTAWVRGNASAVGFDASGFGVQIDMGSGLTAGSSYLAAGHWVADSEI